MATVPAHDRSIPPEDLSDDPLLPGLDTDADGRPVIGGIPLVARIGAGGMGAVYYGMHPRLKMPVAVKILPYQLAATAPETVGRLASEARIAARLHSSHLVRVLDVDQQAGLHYIVMEYVDGVSAKQYIALKGSRGISESEALQITIAAVMGLRDAHAAGVVHRDVKPDNILIPRRSDDTFDLAAAKLTDLGIAKAHEGATGMATGTGTALGTPGFMAPEQSIDAKNVGPEADLFSVGATLYALLTGHPPFEGESVMSVLIKTINEPHLSLTRLRPGVSRRTAAIVDRCLNKQPGRRFNAAKDMIEPLNGALEGASVETNLWPHRSTIEFRSRSTRPVVFLAAYVAVSGAFVAGAIAEHRHVLDLHRAAAVMRAGRAMVEDRPEDALKLAAAASVDLVDGPVAAPALDEIVAASRRQIARRAVSDRVQSFFVHLIHSEFDACRAYIDPRFATAHGTKASGMLGLSSLTLRIAGVTERDVRVTHIALGDADDASACVEVRVDGSWRPIKSVRASLQGGAWYVWLDVPDALSTSASPAKQSG
jgi:hypothetical protein